MMMKIWQVIKETCEILCSICAVMYKVLGELMSSFIKLVSLFGILMTMLLALKCIVVYGNNIEGLLILFCSLCFTFICLKS